MTNHSVALANDDGLPALLAHIQKMQDEALVIENLLGAAMAMASDNDQQDAIAIIEMACDRASRLQRALDRAHLPKVTLMNRRAFVSATPDPMLALVEEWFRLREVERKLSDAPGGENLDTPKQVEIAARCEAIASKIGHGKATTVDGIAAQLEWLDSDSVGLKSVCDLNIKGLRNAVAALKGGVSINTDGIEAQSRKGVV